MTKHPLTDEICEQIQVSIPVLPCDEQGHILSYDGQRILDGMFEELFEVSNAEMRAAYDKGRDDQLEQVMKWLDEHLSNYSDAPWLALQHEQQQQHQELMLMDILDAFSRQPLEPAYRTDWQEP